ncbi:uncharacterized protein [Ptychodera flava]|uniref:uncharacterized protein n=1 Tax=Ptychodera flava TaxID=63121 RepID=UPI003969E8EF
MTFVRLLVAVQLVVLSMECVSNAESPNQIPIQITSTGVSTTHGYEKPTTHDRLTENMVNRLNDLEAKVLKMEDLLNRALDTMDRMSRGEDEHNRAISEMKEKIEKSCSCEGAPWLNKTDDGMEDWTMKLSENEIREIMPNITEPVPEPSSRDRDMMKLRIIENMLNVTAEAMPSERLVRRSVLRRFRREPMAMEESILKETAMDLTMMSRSAHFQHPEHRRC